MKTPSFWYQPRGFCSTLLFPFAWIYEKVEKGFRAFGKAQRYPIPIISVGNVVCGGAGKTPTSIAIAQLLQKKGIDVHFVTRGYKGLKKGPLKVDTAADSFRDVGDEPLLLSGQAPTWVAKERPHGVLKSIENGARVIILDDGHQTTGLHKDISFVVVDLLQKFGNERVMPAGPLRENLEAGLDRADALISIGEGKFSSSKSIFKAHIVPHPLSLPTNRVVAFCGLGFPQKFYTTLVDLGVELLDQITYPDHYCYKIEDLVKLQKFADDKNAVLVTTRKDFVRVPPSWQKSLYVLDIKIKFEDEEGLYQYMSEKIPGLKECL